MSPAGQQVLPQQTEFGSQGRVWGSHGACWHVPSPQKGVAPSHRLPHDPQFKGSFWRFTQLPPQQLRPVVHATAQMPVPPAPVVPPEPVVPAFPAVPVPPPLPPPHPRPRASRRAAVIGTTRAGAIEPTIG